MMSLYFFTKIDVFNHSNIQNQYNCWKTFFALNKAKYTIIVQMLTTFVAAATICVVEKS